jgi:hypothetical protein
MHALQLSPRPRVKTKVMRARGLVEVAAQGDDGEETEGTRRVVLGTSRYDAVDTSCRARSTLGAGAPGREGQRGARKSGVESGV